MNVLQCEPQRAETALEQQVFRQGFADFGQHFGEQCGLQFCDGLVAQTCAAKILSTVVDAQEMARASVNIAGTALLRTISYCQRNRASEQVFL